MNHYPHHIGDFNNGTRHLTRTERSIYRDLIELYYDTESPLTSDMDALSRRIIARSEEERSALAAILAEFFQLRDGLYFNARCEEELSKYQSFAENGKLGAAKRWNKVAISQTIAPPSFGYKPNDSPPIISPLATRTRTNNQNHTTPLPPAGDGGESGVVEVEEADPVQPHHSELSKEADDFNRFWNAYPDHRRNKMVTTQREWLAMRHQRPAIEFLLSALGNHVASEDWSRDGGKFVPSALNWITEQAWHERKAPAKKSASVITSKAKPLPRVDATEAEAWLSETYPAKAGLPFSQWPQNIQAEFIELSNQLTTQAA